MPSALALQRPMTGKQMHTTSHPRGWLKFQKLENTSVGEEMQKLEPCALPGVTAMLRPCGNSLAVSQEVQRRILM